MVSFVTYLIYLKYALLVCAFVILATGLYHQRRWLHKFSDLREAWHVKEMWSFLRNRVLPPHILQEDEANESEGESEPGEATTPPTPTDQASPEPGATPAVTTVPVPPIPQVQPCPTCGKKTDVGKQFCVICGSSQKPAASPTSPVPAEPATRNEDNPPSLYEVWRRKAS